MVITSTEKQHTVENLEPDTATTSYGGSIATNKEIDYNQYKKNSIVYTASLASYKGSCIVDMNCNWKLPHDDRVLCYEKEIREQKKENIDILKEKAYNFYFYLQAREGKVDFKIYEVWLEK